MRLDSEVIRFVLVSTTICTMTVLCRMAESVGSGKNGSMTSNDGPQISRGVAGFVGCSSHTDGSQDRSNREGSKRFSCTSRAAWPGSVNVLPSPVHVGALHQPWLLHALGLLSCRFRAPLLDDGCVGYCPMKFLYACQNGVVEFHCLSKTPK